MKKCNQQSVLLFMLVAAVGSALVGLASAQSFTTLYNFTEPDTNGINSDGLNPTRLLVSGGTLYGVAMRGGNAGTGTIFTLSTNRTGFTTLYNFTALPLNSSFGNSDGALPVDLALSGNTLYGTTAWGGRGGELSGGSQLAIGALPSG